MHAPKLQAIYTYFHIKSNQNFQDKAKCCAKIPRFSQSNLHDMINPICEISEVGVCVLGMAGKIALLYVARNG